MKIGFDIDSVLLDSGAAYIEWLNRHQSLNSYELADLTHYDLCSSFGISFAECRQMLRATIGSGKLKALPGVYHVLTVLKYVAVRPFPLITLRPKSTEKATHSNCAAEFPNILFMYFMGTEKAEVIRGLKLDWFVEDHLETATKLIQRTEATVILVDQPWNQTKHLPAGIIRAGNWRKGNQWGEVKKILMNPIWSKI